MANGLQVLLKDADEAVRFIAGGGIPRMREYWGEHLGKLRLVARLPTPELILKVSQRSTCARLHVPLLAELLDKRENE